MNGSLSNQTILITWGSIEKVLSTVALWIERKRMIGCQKKNCAGGSQEVTLMDVIVLQDMYQDSKTAVRCGRSDRWVQCGSGIMPWICSLPLLVCNGDGRVD